MRIRYVLFAFVNGKKVFAEKYKDTFDLQNGISDAEDAVGLLVDGIQPEEKSHARKIEVKSL